MTPILIHLQPFDTAANARVDVRIGSALEAEAYGLNSLAWSPAINDRPQMSIEIMSTDLSGRVQVGRTRFSLSLANAGIGQTRTLKWGGAPVKIYSAKVLAWPAVTEFDGEIVDHSYDIDTGLLSVTAEVSTSLIEKPLLTLEFDGSTGAGGDAAKRGTLKPAGFGSCENIPPVWFDSARNIGMIDGYGNCTAITKLMEGASDMGASVGNYASYAALAAAIDSKAIAPGRWGTCLAEGLVGLGAPPVGVIGVNATFGSNRLGAMMSRILTNHAGVAAGQIDSASFTALDTALNYPAHYWTDQQIECKTLLEMMARSANATLIMSFQRKVSISRAVASAAVATLDRSGGQTPRCIDWKILSPMKPVWRVKARAARPAQVLDFDQVNYVDTIIDRGAYSSTTVYRAGNLVWMSDKSSWLYTNATATSGNAPPTYPATSNAYWQNLAPPANAANITYASGATLESLKPAEPGANVTETRTAAAIANQGPAATDARGLEPLYSVTANIVYDAGFTLGGQGWTLDSGWSLFRGAYADGALVASSIGGTRVVASPNFAINPGVGVYLSLDMFAAGVTAGSLNADIQWLDSGGSSLGTSSRVTAINGVGWRRYNSAGLTAPAGTVFGRVRIFLEAATNTNAAARLIKVCGVSNSPFTDDATYGALYQTGQAIDALKPAEVGANVTANWTAAAIANQAAWATYSGDSPSTYQLRVQYMDTSGQLSGIDRIVNRRMTLLKRADGITNLSESMAITSLGTAAAIANQGPSATDPRGLNSLYRPPANIVPDGGFRLRGSGWTLGAWGFTAGGNEGPYILCSSNGSNVAYSPKFGVYGTGQYTVGAEIYNVGVSSGEVCLDIEWWNGATYVSTSTERIQVSPGQTWGRSYVTATAPSTATNARLRVFTQNAVNSGGSVSAVRRIKVSGGTEQPPFSDDVTDGALYGTGAHIDTLRPAEFGANVTANWTAAAIANQAAWATLGWSTNRISQLYDNGRAVDGRLLNSSNNYGLRALSEVPTFSQTNAGSSVTLDLGSNGKLYSDWGSTITLPSATITGLAYSTTYYIWRNMPSPDGAGSSYGYSSTLTDALGVGKVYLGYVTTMSSGGTGGGGGGYGGGNCVVVEALMPIFIDGVAEAADVMPGYVLTVLNEDLTGTSSIKCTDATIAKNECVTLETTSGITLTLALNTPMTLPGGLWEVAANMTGKPVAVLDHGHFRWETVRKVVYAGLREVANISCGNATFAAGDQRDRFIFSHNILAKP